MFLRFAEATMLNLSGVWPEVAGGRGKGHQVTTLSGGGSISYHGAPQTPDSSISQRAVQSMTVGMVRDLSPRGRSLARSLQPQQLIQGVIRWRGARSLRRVAINVDKGRGAASVSLLLRGHRRL